jgi:beta-aspartyl-peptidase (threonine type)
MASTESTWGQRREYAIVVHGGAIDRLDSVTDEQRTAQEDALRAALAAGQNILEHGGSSLDAVERIIRLLEDDPIFNAGRGAVLNSEGKHELDASIMDGQTLGCGAVASVRTVKNPISLARLVMTKTPHVLLAGDGAEKFADEMGIEREPEEYFRTQERIDEWQKKKEEQSRLPEQRATTGGHMGTVGCAALDKHGNLAAGTSTGGRTFKRYGRIGDSPIIGAGTYANNRSCAVSCTGIGEEFIRRSVAFNISAQMIYRRSSLEEAVRDVIQEQLPGASGGIIAVDNQGRISMQFNTAGMARGAADSTGLFAVKVGD